MCKLCKRNISKENKKEKITTNIENEKSFGGGLQRWFPPYRA
mgnify:CR=1 FL=1